MVASAEPSAPASFDFAPSPAGQAASSGNGMGGGHIVVAGRSRVAKVRDGDDVLVENDEAQRTRPKSKTLGPGDWNACTINDPERSLQSCRRVIDPGAAGPNGRSAAHVADGLSHAWQGDLDGAIADFDRAIAISPRNAIAYLNRGLALQRKGELARAAADLDRAVRYAPQAARVYYNRGQLLRQRGEPDRARADEGRAVALDPDYAAVVK
jgi:tetratricopeptide (TPR) repeat protein